MEHISYSSLRQKLAFMLDKVNADHTPVMITRKNGTSAVLMSLDDFKSYEETAYLMANPANGLRLHEALKEAEVGKLHSYDMLDE